MIICNGVFCLYEFYVVLTATAIISLHNINQLIFVMVKCCVLIEVLTDS
jgi:hypothetical protein